ncbi:MsnO8 family LLM class oxidoreductase [Pyxidicoccus sp. 3LG]
MNLPLSVLDLAPIGSGSNSTQALRDSLRLAQHVERLGYHRLWYAEHHGMPGIASSAPDLLIAHAAQVTSRVRLGSGGVMLPNHAPLAVAERFGILESLHPGRIDLGIGRAPRRRRPGRPTPCDGTRAPWRTSPPTCRSSSTCSPATRPRTNPSG